MNLTDEQALAVDAREERFTLWAAAGSGKTSVLVRRFLRLVTEENCPPDRILTITFTRKAAAEMKRRIVRSLIELGRPQDAQRAETGPIQTIHGFCERLLRENSLLAGIDPGFEILGPAASAALREEAIRWAIENGDEETPEIRETLRRLAGRVAYGRKDLLSKTIQDILSNLRGSGWSAEEIAERHKDTQTLLNGWLEQALGPEHQPGVDPMFQLAEARSARKAARQRVPDWLRADRDPFLEEGAELSCGAALLACLAWSRMEGLMRERQTFDFVMLEELAVRLAENPAAAARIRSQYDAALVDESQDVNPVQYRLLDRLALPQEMLVGDPQQSIYGFRMADRRLFIERSERQTCLRLSRNFRSEPGILAFVDRVFGMTWGESYHPMTDEPLDLDAEAIPSMAGVELWPVGQMGESLLASQVEAMMKEHGLTGSQVAVIVREGKPGLAIVKALQARGIPARLAGGSERFYTRLEVRDLANALSALSNPSDRHAWLAFLLSPLVGLSLDATALLTQAPSIPAALQEAATPMPGDREALDRFLAWHEPLARVADRLPAWELISELFARTRFLEELARRPQGQQRLANVRKLLRLAAQEPELGAAEFAERIRDIQQLKHQEGDAPVEDEEEDLVTVLTAHKAKGLEFDAVVATFLAKPDRSRSSEVEADARLGLTALRVDGLQSLGHGYLFERRTLREREEELRVAYVALTRAKRLLCVVTPSTPKNASFGGRIATALVENLTPPPGLKVRDPAAPVHSP